jgi:hypothetical protein
MVKHAIGLTTSLWVSDSIVAGFIMYYGSPPIIASVWRPDERP